MMSVKSVKKNAVALAALALLVGFAASWTTASSAARSSANARATAFQSVVLTPITSIDVGGGIIVRQDPPELSAVFPVLP